MSKRGGLGRGLSALIPGAPESEMQGGALDVRATEINEQMKLAAANAIAGTVGKNELSEEYIIPSVFNRNVVRAIARDVAEAARHSGVARRAKRHPAVFL